MKGKGDTLVYNGDEQTVSGFVTNEFQFDGFTYHVGGLTSTASATDTGNVATTITGTAVVYDAHDADVSEEFTVTAKTGNLRITPRPVTITAKGVSVEYDGLEHSYADNLIPYEATNVCSGERVSAISLTGALTHPGREDITIDPTSIRIQHLSPSRDVTNNYTITVVDSAIHITNHVTPYELTLQAKGDTIVYDGGAHILSGFDTLRFAISVRTSGGEYMPVIYHISPASVTATTGEHTVVDNYTNVATGTPVVLDAEDNNVSSQFNVTLQNGNFRIAPRPINIKANDYSVAYDGTLHQYNEAGAVDPYYTVTNTAANTPISKPTPIAFQRMEDILFSNVSASVASWS